MHFHFHERFFLHFPRLICIFMYKSVKRAGRARNASQVIDFACLLGSSPTPKGICILTPPMRGAMAGDDDVDAAAIAIAGPKRQSTKTMFFSPSAPAPLRPLSPAVFRASFAPRRSRSRQLSYEIAELRGLAWPRCNQRRYEESKNLKMKHFSKKTEKKNEKEKNAFKRSTDRV